MDSLSDDTKEKAETDIKTDTETKLYITDLKPHDVLMGRGLGPNEHQGNINFREIVSTYRSEYLATNFRKEKDVIAQKTIKKIKGKSGRFLKKLDESEVKALGLKGQVYVLVDEKIVIEKTKQALRFKRKRGAVASRDTEAQCHEHKSRSRVSQRREYVRATECNSSSPPKGSAQTSKMAKRKVETQFTGNEAGKRNERRLDYQRRLGRNALLPDSSQFPPLDLTPRIPREFLELSNSSVQDRQHDAFLRNRAIPQSEIISNDQSRSSLRTQRGSHNLYPDWISTQSEVASHLSMRPDTSMMRLPRQARDFSHTFLHRSPFRPSLESQGRMQPVTQGLRVFPNIPNRQLIDNQMDMLDISGLVSGQRLRPHTAQVTESTVPLRASNESAITAALRQPSAIAEALRRRRSNSS